MQKTEIYFDKEALVLKKVPKPLGSRLEGGKWDRRTFTYRAPASVYCEIVLRLREHQVSLSG